MRGGGKGRSRGRRRRVDKGEEVEGRRGRGREGVTKSTPVE